MLFVANVPIVPGAASQVLLKSLFARYAPVERVTVVENPWQATTTTGIRNSAIVDDVRATVHVSSADLFTQGRFSHVVFASMKRALRSLEQVMSKNTALTLDQLELQALQDETLRLERDDNGDDYDENDQDDSHKRGIVRVVERYRASQVSPAALLEECNAVMERFEDAEEADRRARQATKN